MPAQVRVYTDPACPSSWAAEPTLRRLVWEFDGELEFTWVMGGLALQFGSDYSDSEGRIGEGPDCFAYLISHWLDVAGRTGMPNDPRIWTENPLASTYPACQAVKAATEQANDGALEPLDAIVRFGSCATIELEELSGRSRPVIEAELWGLARDWKLKPVTALTGTIWELP